MNLQDLINGGGGDAPLGGDQELLKNKSVFNFNKQLKVFEDKGRSIHKDIPPAKDRIKIYRRKLVDKYQQTLHSDEAGQKGGIIIGSAFIDNSSRPETAASTLMGHPTSSQTLLRHHLSVSNLNENRLKTPFSSINNQNSYLGSPQVPSSNVNLQQNLVKSPSYNNLYSRTLQQQQDMMLKPFNYDGMLSPQLHQRTFSNNSELFLSKGSSQSQRRALDGKGNFYSYDPSEVPKEDNSMMLAKLWFQHQNQDLKEKRQHEEALVMLKEWSGAKSRVQEDISMRIERKNEGASDPSRISIMMFDNKCNFSKIFQSQEEFLDSNESSLNSSIESIDKKDIESKKLQQNIAKRKYSSKVNVISEEEDDEEQRLDQQEQQVDEEEAEEEDSQNQNQKSRFKGMQQSSTQLNGINSIQSREQTKYIDLALSEMNQLSDRKHNQDLNEDQLGSKIVGLLANKRNELSTSESSARNKDLPFNYASLSGMERKKQKILRLRMRNENIINSKPNKDIVDNIFSSSSNPGTFTISLYNRPATQGQSYGSQPSSSAKFQSYQKQNNRHQIQQQQNSNYFSPAIQNNKQQLMMLNSGSDIRPSTVGYSYSPQIPLFGPIRRQNISIEDRNLHIEGSMKEAEMEIMRISQDLSKATVTIVVDKDIEEKVKVPFSQTVLQKAIILPQYEQFRRIGSPIPRATSLELMKNPFPVEKKAKKGKKGKK